jgi:proteic killer suppression protein
MLNFILAAERRDELAVPPNYGFHPLTGDRAGTFSMTVTRNWRMTFMLNDDDMVIDLDLEDYH